MTAGQDDRWSVRGVALPVRRLAVELARREGVALGPWLTRLIHRAGEDGAGADGASPGAVAQRLNMVEVAVAILSQRVTALEIEQELGNGSYHDKDSDGAAAGPFHNQ